MKGTDLPLSPKTREVLDWLDARRRTHDNADSEAYNAITWNEQADSRIIDGPGSELIPLDRGRSRTRGMRP